MNAYKWEKGADKFYYLSEYSDSGNYVRDVVCISQWHRSYWFGSKPSEKFPDDVKTLEQMKAYALVMWKMES